MIKWNLGCSDRHFPGYINIDLAPPADLVANLEGPWPGEDSTVNEIRAYDIIEHIGDCDHISHWTCNRCFYVRVGRASEAGVALDTLVTHGQMRHFRGPIHVMNEAWRVLKPGGLFDIEVPTTEGRGAFQDPTHVTWWNRNSFLYYTAGDPHRERFGDAYGVKARFKVRSEEVQKWPHVEKLKIILEAVK